MLEEKSDIEEKRKGKILPESRKGTIIPVWQKQRIF